jgi:hypothetical protein
MPHEHTGRSKIEVLAVADLTEGRRVGTPAVMCWLAAGRCCHE